jgi:hypothetical protein
MVFYAFSRVSRTWVTLASWLFFFAVLLWLALESFFPSEVTIGDFVICLIGAPLHPVVLYWKLFRLEKQGTRVGGRLQTAFGRDKFGARTSEGMGAVRYAEVTKLTILRGFVFVECRNAKRSVTRVKETCHWSE